MNLEVDGGITYQYYRGQPDYKFGAGRSYTTFNYSWATTTTTTTIVAGSGDSSSGGDGDGAGCSAALAPSLAIADVAKAPPVYCVNVSNTGARGGDVVALAFIRSNLTGWPTKRLFGAFAV